MSKIERAINLAVAIANDSSHGYDQINRWGKDYDCSSLVIRAFEEAGIPVKSRGATYTGNMRSVFMACGFKAIRYPTILKRGDVLLNERYHTAIYLGNNQIVHASINEKGTSKGGKVGDQTGKEICVRSFYEYSKGWDYVLRLEEETNTSEVKKVMVELSELRKGSKGNEVKSLQALLNRHGAYLTVDGDFGKNTNNAVTTYQKSKGLTVDGVVGKNTWKSLLTK